MLSWRAVSLDGHPVGGTVVFSIGAPSAGPDFATDRTDPSVAAALWVCKLVLYVGLFAGVGASFFRTWLAPRHEGAGRILDDAGAAGLVATPVAVGLQGADALGVPLSKACARPSGRATGFETSFGPTAIAAAFALFAGLCALRAPRTLRTRPVACSGCLRSGLALALAAMPARHRRSGLPVRPCSSTR